MAALGFARDMQRVARRCAGALRFHGFIPPELEIEHTAKAKVPTPLCLVVISARMPASRYTSHGNNKT
jgi:hypothetical protein